MPCVEITSVKIDLKLANGSPKKRQELQSEFEKFLDIKAIFEKFGRLDDACCAILERAQEWRLKCRRCHGATVSVLVVKLYQQAAKRQKVIASVDILAARFEAPSRLISLASAL